MHRKYRIVLLAFLFCITLGVRLYFALSTPYFSDDRAYYALRQVNHIRETGRPMTHDALSYGGRSTPVLPLFYYLLASGSIIFDPMLVAKVLPNIFASSLVIIIYLLVRHLTDDDEASLLTAFISGFIPIYVAETINSVSVYSLAIPLTFLLMYLLFRVKERSFLNLFLIILSLYMILSPTIILFILAMGFYFVFLWVEGFHGSRAEIELTLFSLFLVTWFYFIFYREALLSHGIGVIWQNTPREVMNRYFAQADFFTALYQAGIVPMLSGVLVMYYYLVRCKDKNLFLIFSFIIIITWLLLFNWIPLRLGLMYLGVLLTILFSKLFILLFSYLAKTKVAPYRHYLVALLVALFFFTSLLPSLSAAKIKLIGSTTNDKALALSMLANFSETPDMVVATVFEGHVITYYSNRSNLFDTNFLLAPDVNERLRDARTIFTSAIESKPIEIMQRYSADYIMFTDVTKGYYNITKIAYADGECFPLIYTGRNVQIYQRKC